MAKKKQSIEDILDSLREQIDLLEDKINDIEQCECDSDEDIEDEDQDEDEE
jgi:prefoldin subunit 5